MDALLQSCIRGHNRRVDFTFLQQQIEERALGSSEGQHGRQGLTKLLNELRAECRQRGSVPRRTCAKGRTELSRQFQAIVIHVIDRYGPPILAVHPAEHHESDAEPVAIEIVRTENLMTVEQISRLSARQERRELAGYEFVQVEHRDTVGSKATERMRVNGTGLPKRSSEHEIQIHVEVPGLRQIARVAQPPLPACMFARNPTDGVPFSRKDRFGGLLDLWGAPRAFSRDPARRCSSNRCPRTAWDNGAQTGSRPCPPSIPTCPEAMGGSRERSGGAPDAGPSRRLSR